MLWDEPKIFFLERRYFFSIILSEFLKNRVALQQGEKMRCVYEQTQEKKKARAEVYLVPQPETHRLAQLNTLDDWMQNEGARPRRKRH